MWKQFNIFKYLAYTVCSQRNHFSTIDQSRNKIVFNAVSDLICTMPKIFKTVPSCTCEHVFANPICCTMFGSFPQPCHVSLLPLFSQRYKKLTEIFQEKWFFNCVQVFKSWKLSCTPDLAFCIPWKTSYLQDYFISYSDSLESKLNLAQHSIIRQYCIVFERLNMQEVGNVIVGLESSKHPYIKILIFSSFWDIELLPHLFRSHVQLNYFFWLNSSLH